MPWLRRSDLARGTLLRKWVFLLGVGVAWKLVVLTLGAAVPRWVAGDGVAHLPTTIRAFGLQAKETASILLNHPVERRAIIQAWRVMSVDVAHDAVVDAPPCATVRIRVRAYTYFAIPYADAYTVCGAGFVTYPLLQLGS
jgi:hypothetical protein